MIAALSILSMIIGNAVAIAQRDLKRMLAYSGIAHAGFIFLGILPGTAEGFAATLFYIAAYAVMNFGAFAVVTSLGSRGEETADINYWRGLFYRKPFLATVMTIFMLSLAGIPPTVGFFAKLFVFRALVDAQIWLPLAVAIVMTIVSFYYYLRVIVVMLAAPPEAAVERVRIGVSMGTVLTASAVGTMLLGIFPTFVLDWATKAASLHL
jgi:NADH-quinone oxidoreductase subunit N